MNDQHTILPEEAAEVLRNCRYLHLATCSSNIPHVALMNYTFVDKSHCKPHDDHNIVLISFQKGSRSYHNIEFNPNVSLLVHHWTTQRNNPDKISSLHSFLCNINQVNLQYATSATFAGRVESFTSSEEEEFFWRIHESSLCEDNTSYIANPNNVLRKIVLKSVRLVTGGPEGQFKTGSA